MTIIKPRNFKIFKLILKLLKGGRTLHISTIVGVGRNNNGIGSKKKGHKIWRKRRTTIC